MCYSLAMKILTICRANVGRSQMLAGLLQKMFPDRTVISAGTKVVSSTTGENMHGTYLKDTKGVEKVIDVLKEEGIDWSGAMRTQLTPEMLEEVDRVIVMAEPENIPDYLKNHPKMIYWEVADPKGTPIEGHREARDKIKKLVEENIELFK
jgi:protein-tyrosine-phosphatase